MDVLSDAGMESPFFYGETPQLVREHPLSQRDARYLEASGQRAEMEKILTGVNETSFLFIGDSQIRNQYHSLCLLLNTSPSEKGSFGGSQCAGKGASASFIFKTHPDPHALSDLFLKGIRQPDVIYWNAGQNWAQIEEESQFFEASIFRSSVDEAVQSYTQAAPNSKMAFFLSPVPHAELRGRKHAISVELMMQLNDICQHAMQSHVDKQGRRIGVVDGFALTKDKISFTDDGVHYNRLVWDELKMMLTAI